jgi:hypothetical protein
MKDLARENSRIKFYAQMAKFKRHRVFDKLADVDLNVQEETLCYVMDSDIGCVFLKDFFLVECLMYPDGWTKIVMIKRKGNTITLTLPGHPLIRPVTGISVSLVCTEDKLYTDFLKRSLHHYNEVLSWIPHEICVAYFGKNPPRAKDVKYQVFSYNDFHMAYARNRSFEMCSYSHVLTTDLDCFFSEAQINTLLHDLNIIPNHGVFHLRTLDVRKSAGGSFFGLQSVFKFHSYCERFKSFFYEDTEYLMQFSRGGTIPYVYYMPFTKEDHLRSKTTTNRDKSVYRKNEELFYKIMKEGR